MSTTHTHMSAKSELKRRYDMGVGAAASGVSKAVPSLEDEAKEIGAELQAPTGRAAQTGSIIAGIVIAAALLIGFFVISSIDDALPSISNNSLSSDKNSTLDRIGDAMLIGSVVIIVLFSAIILRVLRSL